MPLFGWRVSQASHGLIGGSPAMPTGPLRIRLNRWIRVVRLHRQGNRGSHARVCEDGRSSETRDEGRRRGYCLG
jgi:hypothetical protein